MEIRRTLLSDLRAHLNTPEITVLTGHLVFQLLTEQIKDSVARIHYWRTKSQAEVDFVINYGHRLLPVEVKAGHMKKPSVSRSFRSFIEKYEPPEAWIVNRSYRNEINIGQTKVRFRTWYDLL